MQSQQTTDFIAEARRLGDFYTGIAGVLDNPSNDEDFKFLAAALQINDAEAGYDLETAAIVAMLDLRAYSTDGEEVTRRAVALRSLLHAVAAEDVNAATIEKLALSVRSTLDLLGAAA